MLRSGLLDIAAGSRLWPTLRCQERSNGLCDQPAGFVALVGDGHVVVCWQCSKMYATVEAMEFPRDLDALVGNLRDQARNALEAASQPPKAAAEAGSP